MKTSSATSILIALLLTLFILLAMTCSQAPGNQDMETIGLLVLNRQAKPAQPQLMPMSYAQFRSQAFRETIGGQFTGTYIVNGDSPASSEDNLHQIYDDYAANYRLAHPVAGVGSHALTVYNISGIDIVWNPAEKMNIRYCISTTFGVRQAAVILAMAAATGAWEATANIKFVYDPTQDLTCTSANTNVVFDVNPISGQAYLARAFFPNNSRANRNIMIDSQSFWISPPYTLNGILRHELGHTLGLRHEQTRPEAGVCYEDNGWRALTVYDPASTMHYPQCNGKGDSTFNLTALDIEGIGVLYGLPVVPAVP